MLGIASVGTAVDSVKPSAGSPGPRFLGATRSRLSSVRARATVVGVVVVGVALAVGALGLLSLLKASMTEGVETTARAQLNDVSSLLRLGQLPAKLPSGRGDTFTQVVNSKGQVLATSATLLATTPISRLHPGEEGAVIDTVPTLSGPAVVEPQLRRAVPAAGPELPCAPRCRQRRAGYGLCGRYPAFSGGRHDDGFLGPGRRAAGPRRPGCGLDLVFGGRALRPVEAIRAEVADISGHDLHRRVPEPATEDEVAQLARTMNQMLDRIEASAVSQQRFVADASHELRSPLAALRATLEVAVAHPSASSWPAVAAEALDESRRLQRLVEDLLVLASVDATRQANRRQEVDLDELVLLDARRRRNEEVVIDLHRLSGGRVWGDPDQLARVVRNLMDNGQRHTARQISVELGTADQEVVLAVQDDGPGIPSDERQRLFERFARLDEARSEDEGGTGLGLAIAKEIVGAHGGRSLSPTAGVVPASR